MRRSAAEWSRLGQEFETSGETYETFCARHRMRVKTFQWWRSEFGRRAKSGAGPASKPPRFLPVRVRAATPQLVTVDIVIRDAVLRVPIGTDVSYVASLTTALSRGC